MRIADACFTWRRIAPKTSFVGFFKILQRRHCASKYTVQLNVGELFESSQRAGGANTIRDPGSLSHQMKKFNEKINEVSAHKEAKQLAADGYEPV